MIAVSSATTGTHREKFVDEGSIVRRIWGDGDMVLMVFAGCAAEFALNRAVDWLFFTGKLPGDPIGRLFSTAAYSQQIVFADAATASRTLNRIRAVHEGVEGARGQRIPDWAHRDVLYMLIDYSERAHRLLSRRLTNAEQHELYDVFFRVGEGLGIPDLPRTYDDWRGDRLLHLHRDLVRGQGTESLLTQYERHLGGWRYALLLRIQSILVPGYVRGLMGLKYSGGVHGLLRIYPVVARLGFSSLIRRLLMPSKYLEAVNGLDYHAAKRRDNNQSQLRHAWQLLKA